MALIILTFKWHQSWTHGPENAIQKIHQGIIPRIGGIAIIGGLWFTCLCIPSVLNPIILPSLLAASAIFALGFLEDLTGSVRVTYRLLLSFIPGAALAYWTGIDLTHLGFASLDNLLALPWIAIAFTAFALAGVTHAFNLIDGLNGLAAYSCLWILGGYCALGFIYDDHLVLQLCLLLGSPILGFLLFNWPWGKCFLGDGGAYFLGFWCAWIGVLLVERHAQISPFAPLVICAYPIIEALFSIARRSLRGKSSGEPDQGHLHQLFKIAVIDRWTNAHKYIFSANSLTGLLISIFTTPLIALGCIFNEQQGCLIALFLAQFAFYWGIYSWTSAIKVGRSSANLDWAKTS